MKFTTLKNNRGRKLKWFLFLSCFIGFLLLAHLVFKQEIIEIDKIVYQFVSENLISKNLTPFIKIITNLGSAISLITITVLIILLVKNKKIGIFVGLNLVLVVLLNQFLKIIFQRPRPVEYKMIEELGYSFPSGHSMVSFAFYGFLIYLIYQYVKNKYLKWFLIFILGVLIFLIGISRIYLGVHYTSDVLAGFLVSFYYLTLYIEVSNSFIKIESK